MIRRLVIAATFVALSSSTCFGAWEPAELASILGTKQKELVKPTDKESPADSTQPIFLAGGEEIVASTIKALGPVLDDLNTAIKKYEEIHDELTKIRYTRDPRVLALAKSLIDLNTRINTLFVLKGNLEASAAAHINAQVSSGAMKSQGAKLARYQIAKYIGSRFFQLSGSALTSLSLPLLFAQVFNFVNSGTAWAMEPLRNHCLAAEKILADVTKYCNDKYGTPPRSSPFASGQKEIEECEESEIYGLGRIIYCQQTGEFGPLKLHYGASDAYSIVEEWEQNGYGSGMGTGTGSGTGTGTGGSSGAGTGDGSAGTGNTGSGSGYGASTDSSYAITGGI